MVLQEVFGVTDLSHLASRENVRGLSGILRDVSHIHRELKYLFPAMRPAAERILKELNRKETVRGTGIVWIVTETVRTSARQRSLYAQGRSAPGPIVTYVDGVKSLSNHQYGLAFDVAPTKNGKLVYSDPDVDWNYLAHLARAEKLVSGRDWNSNGSSKDESFLDSPHVEWNRKDRVTYKAAWQYVKTLSL